MDLAELEASVHSLLEVAQAEIHEHRIQSRRADDLETQKKQIEARINPLIEQIVPVLAEYDREGVQDSPTYLKLLEYICTLKEALEQVDFIAAEVIDSQLYLEEAQWLNRQAQQKLNQWRRSLKQDILSAIASETNFFRATDMAIAVKDYLEELRPIGAIEEVVQALLDQINALDRDRLTREFPLARVREGDTHEDVLSFQASVALANRSRATNPSIAHFPLSQPKEDFLINPLEEMTGDLVVFGAHPAMEARIRHQIRASQIRLVWAFALAPDELLNQAIQFIQSADLVVVISSCIKPEARDRVLRSARAASKEPVFLKDTRLATFLETLQSEFKVRALAQKFSRHRRSA